MLFYFSMYLFFINCIAFFLYGIDKWRAKKGRWRISERTLILFALFGGSIGGLLGMKIFHHKTRHLKFTLGLPLILLLQIALIFLILWLRVKSGLM